MKTRMLAIGTLLLFVLSACGDPDSVGSGGDGGGDGAGKTVGYSLVFTLQWQGPLDVDLEVTTPSGEAINFYHPAGDGCAFLGDAGGRPGPLLESVACTSLQPGDYQARVRNLETESVPVLLEISSDGVSLQASSFTVFGESLTASYSVTVPSPTPTP